MKLLVRPNPILGESWPGYLLRLACQNHLRGIDQLASVIGMSAGGLICSDPSAMLAKLGLRAHSARWDQSVSTSRDEVRRVRWSPGAFGRTIRAKVCPQCFDEMPIEHAVASWDRPLEVMCTKHQVLLIDECPRCRSPLSYRRQCLETCDCGFKLSRGLGHQVDVCVHLMQDVLNIRQVHLRPARTFAPASQAEMIALTLMQRWRYLDLGTLGRNRPSGGHGDAFMPTALIRQLHPWFDRWPVGFMQSVARIRERSAGSPTDVIIGKSQKTRNSFPMVREALRELDHRVRTSPRPGKRTVQMALIGADRNVGLRNVMDATGGSYDAVTGWIKRGWLGDVETIVQSNGNKRYSIPKERVAKAIHIAQSTTSVRDMERAIGADGSALRTMALSGVFQAVPHGPSRWNVRLVPGEVFDLVKALQEVAIRGRPSLDRHVVLSKAVFLVHRAAPQLVKAAVDAMRSGELRLFCTKGSIVRLDDISVRLIDLQNWRRRALRPYGGK